MGNSKEYNQKYWLANRKKLLKERAERYRKDKAYRLAVIARARAATAFKKLIKTIEKSKEADSNAKENRNALDIIGRKERRSVPKEGKGKVVRQRTSDNSRKYGNNSEYGKLPEPTVGC